MRATISLSEVMVCRLLILDLRLRRRLNDGRDAVYFEDFTDNDNDDEEVEEVELEAEDLPLALLAHLVIACSTTEARALSRPPARTESEEEEEEEDDLEGRMLVGIEWRDEGG